MFTISVDFYSLHIIFIVKFLDTSGKQNKIIFRSISINEEMRPFLLKLYNWIILIKTYLYSVFIHGFVEYLKFNYVQLITVKYFSKTKQNYFQVSIDIDLKIILLNHQNNYVRHRNWLRECQNFLQHCSSCLRFLHN